MKGVNYIKQQVDTVMFEDSGNCFRSLRNIASTLLKAIDEIIKKHGSDHRWKLSDAQDTLEKVNVNLKRFNFHKGNEEQYITLRQLLINGIDQFNNALIAYPELNE